MATADRMHAGYPAWTPSATDVPTGEGYVGKHRKPEPWRIRSVFRYLYVGYLYVGRHRAH